MTQWEYVKGSEADFEDAPEWVTHVTEAYDKLYFSLDFDYMSLAIDKGGSSSFRISNPTVHTIIAERRKVDDLQRRTNDANLQQAFDTVQRPAHYNQSGIECIDAIAASMTPAEFQAYLKGNVQKYLWRYQHKNGVEDCRKAQWYLDRLVKELSK